MEENARYNIPLSWAGVTSTWGLKKFLEAIDDPGVAGLFSLQNVIGRDSAEIIAKKIKDKVPSNHVSRLADSIINNGIQLLEYDGSSDGLILPKNLKSSVSAVYVCSNNTNHARHVENGIEYLLHTIFEKPFCVVLDEKGNAHMDQISELDKAILKKSPEIVVMDAEHYAYKVASQIFYKEVGNLLRGRKIKSLDAFIIEEDNPICERNKTLFATNERTGLLTDTGVHAISFITNLGGLAVPINATYSFFPGYESETSVDASYEVTPTKDSFFEGGTKAEIHLEKFAQEKKIAGRVNKGVIFTLTDDSKIEVDFGKLGGVYEISSNGERRKIDPKHDFSSNEYVNSLREFHRAITSKDHESMTSAQKSLRTMRSIYETYLKCSPKEKAFRREVYK